MSSLNSSRSGMPAKSPVFKYQNDDFRVFEAPLSIKQSNENDGNHVLINLRKSGFTTFQAMTALADATGCKPDDISCAGLKDEDGVTSQLVSIPRSFDLSQLECLNGENRDQHGNFMLFERAGYSEEPIKTGDLIGNFFHVTIRNISVQSWDRLGQLRRRPYFTFFMVNYYDEQRFGVPGGPQTTHQIGSALLREDFECAFRLLRSSKSAESEAARNWRPELRFRDFFDSVPQRQLAFYKSAYHSALWNERLSVLLASRAQRDKLSTIPVLTGCLIPADNSIIMTVMSECPSIEYITYRPNPVAQTRDTISQIRLKASELTADEVFRGAMKQTLEFFLPTGHYATMLLKQIIARMHLSD